MHNTVLEHPLTLTHIITWLTIFRAFCSGKEQSTQSTHQDCGRSSLCILSTSVGQAKRRLLSGYRFDLTIDGK